MNSKLITTFLFQTLFYNLVYAQNQDDSIKPQQIPIEITTDEAAEFIGGQAALNTFLMKNLIYPEFAIENGIQGKCYVSMVINLDGSLSDLKVIRGIPGCPECDAEALRLIKIMPKWKPGKTNGKNVTSKYMIPLIFKLN